MHMEYTEIKMNETYELLRDVMSDEGIVVPAGSEVKVITDYGNGYLFEYKNCVIGVCSLEDLDYPIIIKI